LEPDSREPCGRPVARTRSAASRKGSLMSKQYPPRQRAASFSVHQIVEKMQKSLTATQGD